MNNNPSVPAASRVGSAGRGKRTAIRKGRFPAVDDIPIHERMDQTKLDLEFKSVLRRLPFRHVIPSEPKKAPQREPEPKKRAKQRVSQRRKTAARKSTVEQPICTWMDAANPQQKLGRLLIEDILELDKAQSHNVLLVIPSTWRNIRLGGLEQYKRIGYNHRIHRNKIEYFQLPCVILGGSIVVEDDEKGVGSFVLQLKSSIRKETITLEEMAKNEARLYGYYEETVNLKDFWQSFKRFKNFLRAGNVMLQLLQEVESDPIQTHELYQSFARLGKYVQETESKKKVSAEEKDNTKKQKTIDWLFERNKTLLNEIDRQERMIRNISAQRNAQQQMLAELTKQLEKATGQPVQFPSKRKNTQT